MSKKCPISTAELIYQIGQLEDQFIRQHLSSIGIRMDHARLLHYVGEVPGTNQVSLATFLNVQPATLTNMIKKLEKQNLIIRRTDPDNPHMKQIFLMPDGGAAVAKINQVFNELNDLVTAANLTEVDQLTTLYSSLVKK
ncbi:MarR family transcripitonal regulator [Lactiplantibacillus fabifermentans T30PCM01]|uniref:MarR family transcripitonal regulator n=1 Tax=Lactiplantibacillus fabifermentans T30PCM01 TaxID=1400520 RepID=W6TBF8_9LACO|nr:MarR family transcriptional regulator [Lactiplantibacillus fabifermentans]ETY72565.1 MarR family transcripitonal regulator [Lactiplantibacillus fabifermentans T30PCM01]